MNQKIRNFYNKTKINVCKNNKAPYEEWPELWKKVFYKTYPRFPKIKVQPHIKNGELESLISKRESTREFSKKSVSKEELYNLLYYSSGLRSDHKEIIYAKRNYPSAGARYPIEIYSLNDNIFGLKKGIYHYNVKENYFELILKKNLSNEFSNIVDFAEKPALFLVLTAVLGRSEVKYGINSYRFALLEAGHMGQNISLLSEKYNLGCCAIGGFDNNKLSKLLDLTEEEIPIYMFAIGNKKS